MGTSRSNNNRPEWAGSAFIFSGRPDPTWSVDKSISRRLEEIWDSLEPLVGERPSPPLLGYRGCLLRDEETNREWVAYGGVVSLKEAGTYTSRSDKPRAFEKLLLSSAPEGTLPASLMQNGW